MGIDVALVPGIGVAGTGRRLARGPQPAESRRLLVTLLMAAALLHDRGLRPRLPSRSLDEYPAAASLKGGGGVSPSLPAVAGASGDQRRGGAAPK
ncbi:hypothetical protein, partial [Pararhodobacter aggregans]|uniref:hypothetical protein n=1 Tax=Pararhodobacter aggregans TaxID=404875 RepID=UPI003A93C97A